MKLGSPAWLRVVFLATMLVFIGVATYLYAFRFFAWLESDAPVPVLLASRALEARSPLVGNWYYANGDLWVIAPHLLAILPVAILGVGPTSLLVANILGLTLETFVFVKIYLRLSGERWIAIFAAIATLMAWSNAHVAYVYIQLAYGFITCLWLLTFYVFAALAHDANARPWRFIAAGLLVAVVTVGNPARHLVYVLAPLLAGCAWPWRAFALRRRLELAAAAIGGWAIAYAVYTLWLARVVAWSIPRGHVGFVILPKQITANLAMLGRGLMILCAGGAGPAVRAIPGALLLVGALALVCRETIASRTSSALRWLSVVVLAQLGALLVPLLVGNVLDGAVAVRYVMPSLLAILGLAVVIAVRTVGEAARIWWRRVAIGWLAMLPIAALVAATDVRPPVPVSYEWPDAGELETVADELVRRGLTHGFAGNLAANLLTLDSHGAALTCRITTQDILMPQRWLADTSCYTAATLPDRFYVVLYQNDYDRTAVRATLPAEVERFSVGPTYEVYVFRTEPASTRWLDLPIPDGELATFPLRIPATHLELRHANAAVQSGELVATGEPGLVVWGPYLDLPKGDYTATWIGHGIESAGQLTFTVTGIVHLGGRRKLAAPITLEARAIPRDRSELIRLPFSLKHAQRAVEFQVQSAGGGRISLTELVIERR